jgi:hypothetical protein
MLQQLTPQNLIRKLEEPEIFGSTHKVPRAITGVHILITVANAISKPAVAHGATSYRNHSCM